MINASINLSPNRQCRSCCFNARSPYLVCAVHPMGPEQRQCPDFESLTPMLERSSGDHLPPTSTSRQEDWMGFWGPTEEEWLAFWSPENLRAEE